MTAAEEKKTIARQMLEALPEWFGIPEAREEYIADSAEQTLIAGIRSSLRRNGLGWIRVDNALKAVGMYEYRKHSPNKLSGGQKQRVSIAGVIAMHPKCIILDEPTAMLDPNGRKEVIRAVRALNDVERVTVILITHYMEEIIYANKVFVMDAGRELRERFFHR